jgi:hypothetical protein
MKTHMLRKTNYVAGIKTNFDRHDEEFLNLID